jgi:hypothetical protein
MDTKGLAVVLGVLLFFFITPTPVINSVTPATGANTKTVEIQVNGAKFVKEATVKLCKAGEEDINAASVNFISEQKIICNFDLQNKALGKWDVVVTNKKFRAAKLKEGFEIINPAPQVTEVKKDLFE